MEQEVDSRIPDQIATWIESTLGPWALVADVSWPRSNSCVWQVRLGEADAFVKISPSAGAFHRERSALGKCFRARWRRPRHHSWVRLTTCSR